MNRCEVKALLCFGEYIGCGDLGKTWEFGNWEAHVQLGIRITHEGLGNWDWDISCVMLRIMEYMISF